MLCSHLAAVVLSFLLASQAPTPVPLVLRAARVLAPDGGRWLENHEVVVADGRIVAIAPRETAEIPSGAVVRELGDVSIVPGLIDLHTHLLLHPYDEAEWSDQVLKESTESRVIRGVTHAKATLDAGFTTLRDLGTEGAGLADVALRDSIAAKRIPGPRVLAVTYAIVARGCYGPPGFDPRLDLPVGAQEVSGADAMRAAVREQLRSGADWIKVYADYHRGSAPEATATLTPDELAAAVDEARQAGVKVAAHATSDEGIRNAVKAGVATIEHGQGASDATLKELAARGVVLCPTLAAVEATGRYLVADGGATQSEATARLDRAIQRVADAKRLGVTLACGSDAGVFRHGDNAREIELLESCGLTAKEALATATRVAADVLGRSDLGRLVPGATADLLVSGGDPLYRVNALRDVRLVVADGRIAFESAGQ